MQLTATTILTLNFLSESFIKTICKLIYEILCTHRQLHDHLPFLALVVVSALEEPESLFKAALLLEVYCPNAGFRKFK